MATGLMLAVSVLVCTEIKIKDDDQACHSVSPPLTHEYHSLILFSGMRGGV